MQIHILFQLHVSSMMLNNKMDMIPASVMLKTVHVYFLIFIRVM